MELIKPAADATAEEKRELGKHYFLKEDAAPEEVDYGVDLLWEAHVEGDNEAHYWVALMILHGDLKIKNDNSEEYALYYLGLAARNGDWPSRCRLDEYCKQRYAEQMDGQITIEGPLMDFSGKRIRISRTGVFAPVDVTLTYKGGQNILTIRTNVAFLYAEELPERDVFEEAVCAGFRAWQGDYTVFGGQKLTVRVEVTRKKRKWDNLFVFPITPARWQKWLDMARSENEREDILQYVHCKRSKAQWKRKWTAYTEKRILMQFRDDRFDDYEKVKNVAKHEFGHILGVGDLYCEQEKGLPGVEKGTYKELDSYAMFDKRYNLVMCNEDGIISNNDIEMVVLAFQRNKLQTFQASDEGEISIALGRGN